MEESFKENVLKWCPEQHLQVNTFSNRVVLVGVSNTSQEEGALIQDGPIIESQSYHWDWPRNRHVTQVKPIRILLCFFKPGRWKESFLSSLGNVNMPGWNYSNNNPSLSRCSKVMLKEAKTSNEEQEEPLQRQVPGASFPQWPPLAPPLSAFPSSSSVSFSFATRRVLANRFRTSTAAIDALSETPPSL